jgi:hypothetical protein
MTKVIAALMVAAVLYGSWEFFLYWERVGTEKENQQKAAAAALVRGDQLPGLPYQLENFLQEAESKGAPALKEFLQNYGRMVEDPRKAWIQLDYCVLVARDDPAEARRVFAQVKARTPTSSPVWPRIKELEHTYH